MSLLELPNDVLNNIKSIYETPLISLESEHHDSRIMLCIKYPHFSCKFNMHTSIGTQREEEYSEETGDDPLFAYGGKYNPIEYVRGQAYRKGELTNLCQFIENLKRNKHTIYYASSEYDKHGRIEIHVDKNIKICNEDNDHRIMLDIKYKNSLIEACEKYVSILGKHPSL